MQGISYYQQMVLPNFMEHRMANQDIDFSQEPGQVFGYRIVVEGEVNNGWFEWFEDVDLEREGQVDGCPVTVLTGRIPDQAALRGLLNRIWDLNLKIIAFDRFSDDLQGGTDEQETDPAPG
jgi:glycerol-3-phosphate O-acyltransferase